MMYLNDFFLEVAILWRYCTLKTFDTNLFQIFSSMAIFQITVMQFKVTASEHLG